MKAWKIDYEFKGEKYSEILVSDRPRSARFKLSMKHRCPLKNIKILNSQPFLDTKKD